MRRTQAYYVSNLELELMQDREVTLDRIIKRMKRESRRAQEVDRSFRELRIYGCSYFTDCWGNCYGSEDLLVRQEFYYNDMRLKTSTVLLREAMGFGDHYDIEDPHRGTLRNK